MPVEPADAPEGKITDQLIKAGAPPVPAAQPGAEAPLSPPGASGRDFFTQMGIPQSGIDQLDAQISRSAQISSRALDALAAAAEQREGATDRIVNMERPAAPDIRDVPPPPELPDATDTLRVFGQFLPVLAMLGGAFNRNSATAALRAGAAAMQAARDNDAAALERSHEQWEREVAAITAQNETALQRYQAATQLYATDIDAALAELTAIAAQEQNPLLQANIEQGNMEQIATMFTLRTNAYQAVTNAFLQQQEINARAAAGAAARPLRGPDAAQMTRIRETAEASRGLRGLAAEFESYLGGGDQTGPISGSVLNVPRFFDPEMQAMSALQARMTGLMRPVGSGATSDFEQRLYARGAPGINKTPEANAEIISGIRRLGEIADARQFFYEDYATQYGNLNGAERAFQQSPEFVALAGSPGAGGGNEESGAPSDPLGIR